MRKVTMVSGFSVAVLLAGGASANGQLPVASFNSELRIVPKKSGTQAHPKGVRLVGRLAFVTEAGFEPPRITRVRLRLPRGLVYSAADRDTCTRKTLQSEGGVDGCPKGSIVGTARGEIAGADFGSHPAVVLVNAGGHRVWAVTTYFQPALVRELLLVEVRKVRGRRWSHQIIVPVPKSIVAGVPVAVPSSFTFEIGGQRRARRYLMTDRPCPKRGFRTYEVSIGYEAVDGATGEATRTGQLACR
jgi:hypothetical protein